jgi:hypothetical protein
MSEFRLPNSSERAVVIGRTGTGKTVFMKWLLSMSAIEELPWIVIDHKNDKSLDQIPHIQQIKLGELPKSPGLYIVKARVQDDDAIDAYLHRILARGRTGIFTDEGASLPQREPRYMGLKAIFAQGRSKRTPILFGTQRPVRINKSVASEGDFFAVSHLSTKGDRDYVRAFVPGDLINLEKRLDDYCFNWYDVKQFAAFVIRPVDDDETTNRLDWRLRPRRFFV